MLNGLRLSLTSGQSISAEGTTSSTLYLVPHAHGRIELFNNNEWVVYTTTGASLALTGLVADKIYDVFAYYDTTTNLVKLELSTAWTSNTTRSSDDSTTPMVHRIDGVYVKVGDTTRRYVGTIRAVSDTTTTDTSSKRFCWNFYNKVDRVLSVIDTTNTWTYAGSFNSANWRGANASTNSKVEYVTGWTSASEAHFTAHGNALAANSATADYVASVGIGLFSSGSNSALTYGCNPHSLTLYTPMLAEHRSLLFLGYRTTWWLDGNNKSGLTGYLGDNNTTVTQSGMVGTIQG